MFISFLFGFKGDFFCRSIQGALFIWMHLLFLFFNLLGISFCIVLCIFIRFARGSCRYEIWFSEFLLRGLITIRLHGRVLHRTYIRLNSTLDLYDEYK